MSGFFERQRKVLKAAVIARRPEFYWRYRMWRRGWAEKEMRLLPSLCESDKAAVDVGANHGLFTHHLTQLAAEVHAFEASPRMAAILRSGYLRRGNLHVHEVALSNQAGEATLRMPTHLGLSGYATLEGDNDIASKVDLSDGLEEIVVQTRTLDSFELSNISFVKVDVEGHEQEVLEGGVKTLEREHPVVMAELEDRHRPGAVQDVHALMEGLGYRTYFMRGDDLLGFSHFDPERNQDQARPELYVRNFIFIHEARDEQVRGRLKRDGFGVTSS